MSSKQASCYEGLSQMCEIYSSDSTFKVECPNAPIKNVFCFAFSSHAHTVLLIFFFFFCTVSNEDLNLSENW